MTPQHVHALITGTYDYIMFHVRRDCANVIKFMDFRDIILDFLGGPHIIT